MRIHFIAGGIVIATAMLDDNDSAKDLASLLPLDLALNDYASTEKIADLPRSLSVDGAPEACTPVAGDIAFYAPWGNLAIFYRDGQLSEGLVRLGRLDSGLDAMQSDCLAQVRVEGVKAA